MEGQVERNALWDTQFHVMCSVYTADFGNAVDHPDIPSTQKICLLHTRAIIWGRTTGNIGLQKTQCWGWPTKVLYAVGTLEDVLSQALFTPGIKIRFGQNGSQVDEGDSFTFTPAVKPALLSAFNHFLREDNEKWNGDQQLLFLFW